MDVYLESMERIMADIVTLRFGVKSHDHKSSRSNQAHWQALLVLHVRIHRTTKQEGFCA
jgi:hypothetical protein